MIGRPDCNLLVNILADLPLSVALGRAQFGVVIPNVTALLGVQLAAQTVTINVLPGPGASVVDSLSNGLNMTIGNR